MSTSPATDVFSDAIQRLDRAFEYAEIDEEAVEKLRHPKAILQVSIPVRMGLRPRLEPHRHGDRGAGDAAVLRQRPVISLF